MIPICYIGSNSRGSTLTPRENVEAAITIAVLFTLLILIIVVIVLILLLVHLYRQKYPIQNDQHNTTTLQTCDKDGDRGNGKKGHADVGTGILTGKEFTRPAAQTGGEYLSVDVEKDESNQPYSCLKHNVPHKAEMIRPIPAAYSQISLIPEEDEFGYVVDHKKKDLPTEKTQPVESAPSVEVKKDQASHKMISERTMTGVYAKVDKKGKSKTTPMLDDPFDDPFGPPPVPQKSALLLEDLKRQQQ